MLPSLIVNSTLSPSPALHLRLCIRGRVSNIAIYTITCVAPGSLITLSRFRSVAYPAISDEKFYSGLIPLPPTEEQSRIVAKVDELMTLCDTLETQRESGRKLQNASRQTTLQAVAASTSPQELQTTWTRLAENFGHLFSAPEDVAELGLLCVELAIRGDLAPGISVEGSETAVELMQHPAARKKGRRVAKLAKPEEPFSLPDHWQWVSFEDLLQDSDSGWSPKCDPYPRQLGEWGVLKVSAVTWGVFRPDENKRLPPSLDPRPECEVKPGDFLLSRANTAELVARSVVVDDDVPDRLLMSDKIVRLTFIDPEIKAWANLVNNSLYARNHYRRNATGTSDSMRNVSRQTIHELLIPLPPKSVQQEILGKLVQLHALCDVLARQLGGMTKHAERLAASTVSRLTGITIEQAEDERVKAPHTEVISPLRLGRTPDVKTQAPLATLLARHHGEMSARDLWQRFGGEIDTFYAQLKAEVANGWIEEPGVADVREMESDTVAV
jgi:type I restriction enzyme, S subunit